MFHIKSLELVHWDYWQRIKNIPLDAKIITIAGQNGSGKTTLLDALRTLFGLDCSMKRTYKDYARHSGQQVVWLRAVVDNKATGKQTSQRPFRASGFFLEDDVTLFCQIQKNGGDWKRQYLLRGGVVQIEDVSDASDWLGIDNYRKRLANAGLSPAMTKVLALEQGETDKLCEYTPRQLLDLVFQVFGDKEVLDAYDEAKRHQRDTESELQRFETELKSYESNLESLKFRVERYRLWEGITKERRDLREEILPILQFHEEREQSTSANKDLLAEREKQKRQEIQLSTKREDLAQLETNFVDAKSLEDRLETEETELKERLSGINALFKPPEMLLEQRNRLQILAASSGADIADVTKQLEQKEHELDRARRARDMVASKIREHQSTIDDLQSDKSIPVPHEVTVMRRALLDAGIAHVVLSDIVEVKDQHWQPAIEGILRPFAHVVLLEDSAKANDAFRLGEKHNYRHFIVPDLINAPDVSDRSLLSVLSFSHPIPFWLIDQLKRIVRVESIDDGLKLQGSEEWITSLAYHRERRGGRSIRVEKEHYRFGQGGRAQRLDALLKALPGLEAEEDRLTLNIRGLVKEMGDLKVLISGVDAAKELVARQAEFDEAERDVAPLKKMRFEVGERLGELMPQLKPAVEARTGAELQWKNAKSALTSFESNLRLEKERLTEQRSSHLAAVLGMRKQWRNLPFSWRMLKRRHELVEKHQNAHQVHLRIAHLNSDLERDDWETDDTVIDQHARLAAQLTGRQGETDERRYQNNRAIEATTNARGAYIERLRYTIKTYAQNIKALGELAGIEVNADSVHLANDDLLLAQAGLQVRFKFDGKIAIGMNDGEASGGQQVMKSLILLIGLLKSDEGAGGFVFIDEPFAHLDIRNIQLVGEFLKSTQAQYLMTTPLTHNTDVYDPSELTLVTSKKQRDTQWAPPIYVLQKRQNKAA